MALTWDWKLKCGELVVKDEMLNKTFTKSLYEGNAFLIVISEWKENETNMYALYTFFADEAHAKRCLGITGNNKNIFEEESWHKVIKLRINKDKAKNWKKIITMFAQAFKNITIEIYSEEDKND